MIDWQRVPDEVTRLVKASAVAGERLRLSLARHGHTHGWVNPDLQAVHSPGPASLAVAAEVGWPHDDQPRCSDCWVPVKAAFALNDLKVRHLAGPFAQAFGLVPSPVPLFGADSSPLVNTLAGSALTGGAGYALGWLGEQVLPEKYFQKGKLRKTLGLLGAGLGAIPGVAQGVDNVLNRDDRNPVAPWPPPVKGAVWLERLEVVPDLVEETTKQAWFPGAAGTDFTPQIQRDEFNRVIWADPRTPAPVRAATSGLVEAAGLAAGDTPLVSPFDVARIAVAAGSGFLSGQLVGRALGALAGLRPETQGQLQQAGVWAGILSAVVPIALGQARR